MIGLNLNLYGCLLLIYLLFGKSDYVQILGEKTDSTTAYRLHLAKGYFTVRKPFVQIDPCGHGTGH